MACSPWNLVPVCQSCNQFSGGKGDRLPLTPGTPQATANWLHPFFRPASPQVQVRLEGSPKDATPRLYSPDPLEQARLDNHVQLIPSLAKRWGRIAASYYERLVGRARRNPTGASVDTVVSIELEDHDAVRGKDASSMIHAAVCRAVLDRRPGYREEFDSPNAPQLS